MLTEAEVRKQLEEVEQRYTSILKAGMTTDGKPFNKLELLSLLNPKDIQQGDMSSLMMKAQNMMGWASGNSELVLCRNTINLLRIILEIPERV